MVAQRLYLTNSAAPYTPTTKRGGWEQAGATLARLLGVRPAGAAATAAVATGSTGAANDVLWGRWISAGAVAAGTLSGTAQAIVGAVESNAATNANLYLHIYVTTGDSDTPRGTALSNWAGAVEFTTTANGRDSGAQALSSVAVSVGDRLVVEAGYRSISADTTARTATLNYGNSGQTDLAAAGTGVTTTPGWIEFSGAAGIWTSLAETLVDDFASGTINSTRWPATTGTVSVVSGAAALDSSVGDSTMDSAKIYQLRGSALAMDVPAVPVNASTYAGVQIRDDTNVNYAGIYAHGDGTIGFELNGTTTTTITYSSTTHRYWRIRHDGSSLYWETSPDRSTWTARRTEGTLPSWLNYGDLMLRAETGSGSTPAPDYFKIDNVNVAPISTRFKVRKGGAWVTPAVKVRKGGAWVTVAGKARQGGTWKT
jgi:hypothetical protein